MKHLRVQVARLLVFIDRLMEPECPYCRQSPDECRCDPYWRYGCV